MRIPAMVVPQDVDYTKKSVGRPRTNYTTALYEPPSKSVGRPRKNAIDNDTPKKPVGRPRKNPIPEPKPPKVPKQEKVSVSPPPKVSAKPPAKPSVPKIAKQAFFDYLDDETDYVPKTTFTNVKKASKDFLEGIGADMIELFNEIMPEMKGVIPPTMDTKKSAPKEQTKRVQDFMKAYNKLPDTRKEDIKSFMNINRLSTNEIIALIKKKNPNANIGGLDKRELIKRYLAMK
jgi:hypothetical protein